MQSAPYWGTHSFCYAVELLFAYDLAMVAYFENDILSLL